MRQKSERLRSAADRTVKDMSRKTRKRNSSEDKNRIVLAGFNGEDSIAELCRREGIAQSQYYSWSKEFMGAGRKRLAGDTAREANTGEMQDLRREARDLKEWLPNKPMKRRVGLLSRAADHCGRHHRKRTFGWECWKVSFGQFFPIA